ncbi:hypothetical protein ACFQEQ_10515, partial [Halolamina salina]|uniref:hypothetical protein n=1 Tax=Halolamina salina TaxID=1220023 RepID=UPI00361444E7
AVGARRERDGANERARDDRLSGAKEGVGWGGLRAVRGGAAASGLANSAVVFASIFSTQTKESASLTINTQRSPYSSSTSNSNC